MRRRPSARLLVIDKAGRVLLFRFVHKVGPLAGRDYWATPGGGVEPGETYEQAAIRELAEETGLRVGTVGAPVAQQEFELQLPSGERVLADERYFRVRAQEAAVSHQGWTIEEARVIADHKWWTLYELARTSATVYPQNLAQILTAASCVLRHRGLDH